MRAIVYQGAGGSEVIELAVVDDPEVHAGEVLITVAASGLNRADISQREGNYPPPAGASEIPGLEISGTVLALGDGVTDFVIGDRVCALLSGGGYAERVAVSTDLLLRVPGRIDLFAAAALPEALATVYSCLHMAARMRQGDTVLVHGGAGGIGTMAIQLAHLAGARVITTASGTDRIAQLEALGADAVLDYRTEDIVERVRTLTDGRGVDIVLDILGASHLQANLRSLAIGGRIMVIGQQGGEREGQVDLARLMSRRQSVLGLTLRSRPHAEKAEIMSGVRREIWPLVVDGRVHAVVGATYALADAGRAQDEMERSGGHVGKLLLRTR